MTCEFLAELQHVRQMGDRAADRAYAISFGRPEQTPPLRHLFRLDESFRAQEIAPPPHAQLRLLPVGLLGIGQEIRAAGLDLNQHGAVLMAAVAPPHRIRLLTTTPASPALGQRDLAAVATA